MTEDEMKQTWCPDARAAAHDGVGAPTLNRGGGGVPDPYCLCLGRQCSAWRWDDLPNPAFIEWRRQHSWTASVLGVEEPPQTIKSTTDGYCGRGGPV